MLADDGSVMELSRRRALRQLIAGLLALPLSLVPFVAYGTFTPEGRLVRDRVLVALRPPKLPNLSPGAEQTIAAAAPSYRNGVMVLAYHGIGSSDAEGGFVVSPERFGEHLAALRASGMRDVTAAEVAKAFADSRPLPRNAVMITFDDGRADAMLFATPLLAQAGMSATMFVITQAATEPGVYYASWKAIHTYARSGRWDIQSHTATSHREQKVADGRMLPALTSLSPGESLFEYRARIRNDLANASAAIEANTHKRPQAFAYPFGAYGADRTNHPAIRRILREEVGRRYALAFHQDEQESIPLVTANQDRLRLRRLEVEDWSGQELLSRISTAARTTAPSESSAPTRLVAPTDTPQPTPAPGLVPGVPNLPVPPVISPHMPGCTAPPLGVPDPSELLRNCATGGAPG